MTEMVGALKANTDKKDLGMSGAMASETDGFSVTAIPLHPYMKMKAHSRGMDRIHPPGATFVISSPERCDNFSHRLFIEDVTMQPEKLSILHLGNYTTMFGLEHGKCPNSESSGCASQKTASPLEYEIRAKWFDTAIGLELAYVCLAQLSNGGVMAGFVNRYLEDNSLLKRALRNRNIPKPRCRWTLPAAFMQVMRLTTVNNEGTRLASICPACMPISEPSDTPCLDAILTGPLQYEKQVNLSTLKKLLRGAIGCGSEKNYANILQSQTRECSENVQHGSSTMPQR